MKKVMSKMLTITIKATLECESLMRMPARTVTATKANGLPTRDAVKYDKCGNKCAGKNYQPAKSAGQKYRFVSLHPFLSFPPDIA